MSVGPHQIGAALPLDAIGPGTELNPPLQAVSHLPTVSVDEETRRKVQHGLPVPSTAASDGPVALVADTALVAVAEAGQGWLRPRVVLEGS